MFALPRCVYAMAEDGLLFKTFEQVNDKTQVNKRNNHPFSCFFQKDTDQHTKFTTVFKFHFKKPSLQNICIYLDGVDILNK